eukprot:2069253-Prymnesium_polylepis.2
MGWRHERRKHGGSQMDTVLDLNGHAAIAMSCVRLLCAHRHEQRPERASDGVAEGPMSGRGSNTWQRATGPLLRASPSNRLGRVVACVLSHGAQPPVAPREACSHGALITWACPR